MMNVSKTPSVIALALLLALPGALRAADSDGAVTGVGRTTIKRLPQVLRARFIVTGEAKDVAGAVGKLKEAGAAASQKLIALGATEKSMQIGSPRMGAGSPDSRSQYSDYMREIQRAAMQGGAAKAAAKPQFVIVSSTIDAEWALEAANADELFLAGQSLQEKLRSAGIGKRDLKKLKPEDQEAAEEAIGTSGGDSAGEPTFQYVCKVSEADQTAARAEAFAKAKQDAADIAKVAGNELSELRHIAMAVDSPTASEGGEPAFMQAMMQQMSGTPASPVIVPVTDEATALAPIPVSLQITVTASFSIK